MHCFTSSPAPIARTITSGMNIESGSTYQSGKIIMLNAESASARNRRFSVEREYARRPTRRCRPMNPMALISPSHRFKRMSHALDSLGHRSDEAKVRLVFLLAHKIPQIAQGS